MFARYPDRRLTLRDVLRVKLQRLLLVLPVYALLYATGVLPALRAEAIAHLPEIAAALEARRAAPAQAGTPVAQVRCAPVERGTGIVFHRTGGC